MPSFILIHPTVWPQYINVMSLHTGQTTVRGDRANRLQTVSQKSKMAAAVILKNLTRPEVVLAAKRRFRHISTPAIVRRRLSPFLQSLAPDIAFLDH